MAKEANFTVDTNVLLHEKRKCSAKIEATDPPRPGLYCPIVWDGALCWPYVLAGKVYKLPCPEYVQGFNLEEYAYKNCTSTGTWWVPGEGLSPWTNYTPCTIPERSSYVSSLSSYNVSLLERNLPTIRQISRIGYILSLSALIVAFLILVVIRKLRCRRNRLHLHLFVSFMIRASMFLAEDSRLLVGLMTAGVNISDVRESLSDYTEEVKSLPLGCKVFVSIWLYSIMANYSWILMEGLYLHNLIFRALQAATTAITRYVILGWGFPLPFLMAWIVVRATSENTLCWTASWNPGYFWIIRGPITAAIIVNFILFLNITRVIFLKTFSPQSSRHCRYRKWFKSTLVLLPLFGVHYSVTTVMAMATGGNGSLELAWLFVDQIFSSFQGSVVAFLYCFLNTEVRAALWNLWLRWKIAHGHVFSLRDHSFGNRSRHNSREQLSSEDIFGRKQQSVLDRLGQCGAEYNDLTLTVSQNTLSSFVELTESRRESDIEALPSPSRESRFTVSAVIDASAAQAPQSSAHDIPVASEIVLHCSGILVPAILLCSRASAHPEINLPPDSNKCCHLVAERSFNNGYSPCCQTENSSRILQQSECERSKHCLCSCSIRCKDCRIYGVGEGTNQKIKKSKPLDSKDVVTSVPPSDRCEQHECQELDSTVHSVNNASEHRKLHMAKHAVCETFTTTNNQLLKESKRACKETEKNSSLTCSSEERPFQKPSPVVDKAQLRPRSQSEGSKWLSTFRQKKGQGVIQKGTEWTRLRENCVSSDETLSKQAHSHAAPMAVESLEMVVEHTPNSSEQTTLLEKDSESKGDISVSKSYDHQEMEYTEDIEELIPQVESSNQVIEVSQRKPIQAPVMNIHSRVQQLRPRSQSEGSRLLSAMWQRKHGNRWHRTTESVREYDSKTCKEFRETSPQCVLQTTGDRNSLEENFWITLLENVKEKTDASCIFKHMATTEPLQQRDLKINSRVTLAEQPPMTRNVTSSIHTMQQKLPLVQITSGHQMKQTLHEDQSQRKLSQCNLLEQTIQMQHSAKDCEPNPFKKTDFHFLDLGQLPIQACDGDIEKCKTTNPFDCNESSEQVSLPLYSNPIGHFVEQQVSRFQNAHIPQADFSLSECLDLTKLKTKQHNLSKTGHDSEAKSCISELKKDEDIAYTREAFTPNRSLRLEDPSDIKQKYGPISLIDLSPSEEISPSLLREHDATKQVNSLSANESEVINKVSQSNESEEALRSNESEDTKEALRFKDSGVNMRNPFLIYDTQVKPSVNLLEANTMYVNDIKSESLQTANPFDEEISTQYNEQFDSYTWLKQHDLSMKANIPDLNIHSKYFTQVEKKFAISNDTCDIRTEQLLQRASLPLSTKHFNHNDERLSDFPTKQGMDSSIEPRQLHGATEGGVLETQNPFMVISEETNHPNSLDEQMTPLSRSSAYNPFIDS